MFVIRTSIPVLWWWWKSETWTCGSLSLPPGQEVCNGPVCQSRWWWFRSWDHLCWCHCDIIDCTLKRHLRVERQMRAPLRENPQSLPIMISMPLLPNMITLPLLPIKISLPSSSKFHPYQWPLYGLTNKNQRPLWSHPRCKLVLNSFEKNHLNWCCLCWRGHTEITWKEKQLNLLLKPQSRLKPCWNNT